MSTTSVTHRQSANMWAREPSSMCNGETKVLVLCIDVGAPRNLGWADNDGRKGDGTTLATAMRWAGDALSEGRLVALGFEAPLWVPRRADLAVTNARRGGIERTLNRSWSAGAGASVIAAALVIMPWCFEGLRKATPRRFRRATTLSKDWDRSATTSRLGGFRIRP
jgi:hypothetical protein